MTDQPSTPRCIMVSVGLLAALSLVGTRVGMLHLAPGEGKRERLIARRIIEQKLGGRRGAIRDRNGGSNILALDLDVKHVCADPKLICDADKVDEVVASLSRVLNVPPDHIRDRINRPTRRFEYLEKYVKHGRAEQVAQLGLPGIFFRDDTVRYYPHDQFMCHVLGFTNYEGVGSAGVELRHNSRLRGREGMLKAEVDGMRRSRYDRRYEYVAPRNGADVYLTIDQNVQYMVERAIQAPMTNFSAKAAWVVVERIRTGEILAMANRPGYDLNAFNRVQPEQSLNRCIGQVYEPGSTLKMIPIAAALNEGLVSEHTELHCENGLWIHAGRALRDYHPYGTLTVADVLKKSSNIGTAKIALMLGQDRLHSYMEAFGVGGKLGIDLPGEERGILHPVRNWSKLSTSRLSIGQGVAVTALQMVNMYCCIANDGVLMRPYVTKRVVDADGKMVTDTQPEVLGRPVSAETAATMRRLLARVTQKGGTGRRAQLSGISVAGKTGTAQKPVNGRYSDTAYFASFVGFFPAENPEVGMIVVVEEPQPIHTGGRVAAPVFQEIGEQLARYLDVRPDQGVTLASRR